MCSTRAVGSFECLGGGTWDWPSHISTIPGECTCTVPGLSVALNVWGGGLGLAFTHFHIPGECTCTVPGLSVDLNVQGGGDLRLAFTHFYYTW